MAPYAKWAANGYRLPTEAEWEKAARGGQTGERFPWGLTITHNQANYRATTDYPYDMSQTLGYHPDYYAAGSAPYTSPVGSFPPNGYGLFDTSGNCQEWCWDWYQGDYYSTASATDPRGPTIAQSYRVLRGGGYGTDASGLRCAARSSDSPDYGRSSHGFRCVRGF